MRFGQEIVGVKKEGMGIEQSPPLTKQKEPQLLADTNTNKTKRFCLTCCWKI